jgi:hemolysin-activating ACP:hemolysin acyltransferase
MATGDIEPDTAVRAATPPEYRVFRPQSPFTALGLAVNHLMTKPAFARLRFGEWSRVLVGQINRKHYFFVVDGANRVVGFAGWAVTTRDKAEAWVEGRGDFSDREGNQGDCVVFNAWAADTLKVNRFLLRECRKVIQGKETVYFKRHYKDGSTRPVRLKVNEFVEQHIERQSGISGPSDAG